MIGRLTGRLAFWVSLASVCLVGVGCSGSDRGHGGNGDGDGGTDEDGGNTNANTNTNTNSNIDGSVGPPPSIDLTGTLRDFNDTHPDFEASISAEEGIVAEDLGGDGKPVYAGGSGTITTHGQDAFDQWFRDVSGVNMATQYTITLDRNNEGVYVYDNQAFFPIDDQLLGNQGRDHNFHFTYELHTTFTYKENSVFRFIGDDDLWVFINGKLAIDLGGIHGQMLGEVDLDDMAGFLGIIPGNEYTLDFFYAERHTSEAHFRIETTIDDLTVIVR